MDRGLLGQMQAAARRALPPGGVGVAFSGGVDSALLARLLDRMGYGVTLLTVGLPGSPDMGFAPRAAALLGLPHESRGIGPDGLARAAAAAAAAGAGAGRPLSWAENSVAFYHAAGLARDLGLRTLAAANGIDELFCGYDAYRREFGRGPAHLASLMASKVGNEIAMMRAAAAVAATQGARLVQPFLDPGFAAYARALPLDGKVRGPGDMLRKHAVRDLARALGVPEECAGRPKKALQYGTRIHRELLRRGLAPPRPA